MARKKTRKTDDQDKSGLKLRGNLLLKYAAATFELQAAHAKLEAIDSSIKRKAENNEDFAEAMNMMSNRNQLQIDVSKGLSRVAQVARQVCEKLEIPVEKFKDYTVDTETGRVTYVPVEIVEKPPNPLEDKENGE